MMEELSAESVELMLNGDTKGRLSDDNIPSYKEYDKMDEIMGQAWVADEGGSIWRLATVRSVSKDGGTLYVLDRDAEDVEEVPKEKTHPFDPSHILDLDDLAHLNNMHEAPLLHTLHRRFLKDQIYTLCSDVLISINPYKRIPLLYELDPITAGPIKPQNHSLRSHMIHQKDPPQTPPRGSTAGNATNGGTHTPPRRQSLDAKERRLTLTPNRRTRDTLNSDKPVDPLSAWGEGPAPQPHVYTVAARAFRRMSAEKEKEWGPAKVNAWKNQSIIISGESGAGKTEASKYVMRYLITVAMALQANKASAAADGTLTSPQSDQLDGEMIEQCLLQSNTVLEAFGNAKTVRNDNSSRFGKYIKLQYDKEQRLVGAWTDHFLLEKTRLVHVDRGERNYHIFYQILRGLSPQQRAELHLTTDPGDYLILAQGGCWDLDDVDDAQEFRAVESALRTLGLSEEEIWSLWRLLAALLHLGNLEYESDSDRLTEIAHSQVPLSTIAQLMGTSEDLLVRRMRTRATRAGKNESTEIQLSATETKNNVHAVIKHVYNEAFRWIVRKINSCHGSMATAQTGVVAFIGILDIFGFEVMETTNSFEQLCINFANEVLQQQFNMHVFVQEQQEYVKEGLDWTVISFRDNQKVIELVSKRPTGLLIMLEEVAKLKRNADNMALLANYHKTHLPKEDPKEKKEVPASRKSPDKKSVANKENTNNKDGSNNGKVAEEKERKDAEKKRHDEIIYSKPRKGLATEFVIQHFAGQVTYDITSFIEKNDDSLQEDLLTVWLGSDVPFFRNLFTDKPDKGTPGYIKPVEQAKLKGFIAEKDIRSDASTRRKDAMDRNKMAANRLINDNNAGPGQISGTITVSGVFRMQLEELTATLRATEPHYIKTIKPNYCKAPGGFDAKLVVDQLRYSGVLEVVRIRREAYPTRILFNDFYKRFNVLLGSNKPTRLNGDEDYRTACRAIVTKVLPRDGYQMGKRKMFLRDNGLDQLRSAVLAFFAGHAAKAQAIVRRFLEYTRYRKTLRCIRLCQRQVRVQQLRKRFLRHRRHIVRIQTCFRRYSCQHFYVRLRAATIKTQACVRRYLAMQRFSRNARERQQRAESVATVIAAHYRGYRARKAYRTERSARKIQACVRGHYARQAYRRIRASICLQSVARCFIVRRRYKRLRAAVHMQMAIRGFLARRLFRRVKACSKVIACLRGRVARVSYHKSRTAIIILQSVWRMRRAMHELTKLRASVRIQSAIRAWQARLLFCTMRTQARLRRERLERQSACVIQSRYKAHRARVQFRRMRSAAIVVQTAIRGALARHMRTRTLSVVISLQTAYRARSCRTAYQRLLAAIRLQACVRRYLCRTAYVRTRAAIKLQAAFRCYVCYSSYRRLISAIRIQSTIRRFVARRKYRRLISAIRIQSTIRRFVGRRKYLRDLAAYKRLCASIRIQAAFRGFTARARLRERRAAVRIQARVRTYIARQAYLRLRAAIEIQSIMRGVWARRYVRDTILPEYRVRLLHDAAAHAKLSAVMDMLERRPELQYQREEATGLNRTLLHSAAASGSEDLVTYLNPRYPDIMARDDNGSTPLHEACVKGSHTMVRKIFEKACDAEEGGFVDPALDVVAAAAQKLNDAGAYTPRPTGAFSPTSAYGDASTFSSPYGPTGSGFSTPARADRGYGGDNRAAFRMGPGCVNMKNRKTRVTLCRESTRKDQDGEQRGANHNTMGNQRQNVVTAVNQMSAEHRAVRASLRTIGWEPPRDFNPESEMGRRAPEATKAIYTLDKRSYIMSGLLHKRRERGRYSKRFCMLTETHFIYLHEDMTKPTVLNLEHVMLKVPLGKELTFELHSHELLKNPSNREGRLYFMALNDIDLHKWLEKIRCVVGNALHICGKRTEPMKYVNVERRVAMITQVDEMGRTPLHIAIASVDKERKERAKESGRNNSTTAQGQSRGQWLQLIAWLVENGADVNASDHEGRTPAFHAVRVQDPLVMDLIPYLRYHGADFLQRDTRNRAIYEYVDSDLAKTMERNMKAVLHEPHPRLPPPQMPIPGCSYVSLFFETMSGLSHTLSSPTLSVCVMRYSQQQQRGTRLEAEQVIHYPARNRSPAMYWGWAWHMQTSVENLPRGAVAVIELRELQRDPTTNRMEPVGVAWRSIDFDDSKVDSRPFSEQMYRHPIDLSSRARKAPSDIFISGAVWIKKTAPMGSIEEETGNGALLRYAG